MKTWHAVVLLPVLLVYVAVLGMGRARAAGDSELTFAERIVTVASGDAAANVARHVPSALLESAQGNDYSPDIEDGFVIPRGDSMANAVPRRRTRWTMPSVDEEDDEENDDGLWLLDAVEGSTDKPSGWGWLADRVRDTKGGRQVDLLRRRRTILDSQAQRKSVFDRSRSRLRTPARPERERDDRPLHLPPADPAPGAAPTVPYR